MSPISPANEHLAALFDLLPQALRIERLPTHELLFVNAAYRAIFGSEGGGSGARATDWMKAVHPDDRDRVIRALGVDDHRGEPVEYRIERPDGIVVWIRTRRIAGGSDGNAPGWIAFVSEDVTELESAMSKARENRAQLIQAEKLASLGILVAGIAHEINNPNHTIMATSAILEEAWKDLGPLLDEYAEENGDFTVAGTGFCDFRESMPLYLEGLSRASERIRDIVAHLRDFARQDVYDTDALVDVNTVVQSACTLMRGYIEKHTTRFSVIYGDRLPPVKGNASRLKQVVVNLVQNACHALRSTSSAIEITTSTAVDRRCLRVSIRDEGAGIAEQDLAHVLDPFFTTRRTAGGMGLGLPVTRSIIEDHHGTLDIVSKEGVGTTVTVALPAYPSSTSRIFTAS